MIPPNQPSGFGSAVFTVLGIMLAFALLVWMVIDSSGYLQRKDQHMAAGNVMEFTSDNWQKEVAQSEVPVVVDFWAPWCGPCRALTPAINSLASTYEGRVKVGKLNIDDNGDIAAKYGVTSIPRVLIFKGGETPKQRLDGLVSEAKLAQVIDTVLQER